MRTQAGGQKVLPGKEPAATTGGRDGRGRFAPGNAGGPGRPKRASEVSYMLAVAEVVPVERWRGIVEQVATAAENGDHKAREWLARLLLGADPGRLSEVLAGVLADGEHFRVSDAIEAREKAAEDEDDDFDGGSYGREVLARKLVERLNGVDDMAGAEDDDFPGEVEPSI